MICEKKKNTEHDFLKDPIDLIIDGDFIKANNTTLGADNGIGVAYILAILDSKKIKTPKLECIFTAQEETTMNGAKYIDVSMLNSKKMICLDNMYEDELWIGCASSHEWTCSLESEYELLEENDFSSYTIDFYGFAGGHSGIDIGKKRGNPILLMANLLQELSIQTKIYINSIIGGTRSNVIPIKCKCNIFISEKNIDIVEKIILENKLEILKEFDFANRIKIEFYKNNNIKDRKVFSKKSMNNMLQFLNSYKNGVQRYDKSGNVILSSNFGVIDSTHGDIQLDFSMRSNEEIYVSDFITNIEEKIKKYNLQIKNFLELPGYEHKKTCKYEYIKYFNKKPKLIKMHVGLEAGFFNTKIPNLDFIAIAPNIWDAHSTDERLSISSTNKIYEYITILLENS